MKVARSIIISFFGSLLTFGSLSSQPNPNFDVHLRLDVSAAAQCLQLFEDQLVNTQSLAELRGNRIAASTTGLIAQSRSAETSLQHYLDSLRYHQRIHDDVYHLESARTNTKEIKELLLEIKKRNLGQRVVATVEQIIPHDVAVSTTIPLYEIGRASCRERV